MIILNCEICGAEFSVKPYRAGKARFCSKQCGGKWHMANRSMSNDHKAGNKYRLGKRPSNAFTSEQVRGENNPRWAGYEEHECSFCQKKIRKKPWLSRQQEHPSGLRFCSQACYKKHNVGPNNSRYLGGAMTYRGRGWRAIRRMAVQRDKGECQNCGKHVGDSIPVHHKIPYRMFSNPQEANELGNLICLCQSCHMKEERSLPIHRPRPPGASSYPSQP